MTPPPEVARGIRRHSSRRRRQVAAVVALAAAVAVLAPVATSPAAGQSSGGGGGVVVIANGWSSADVGAAAPLAGRLDAAVLYASKGELGQPTVDVLEELDPSRVLLMGGPAALTSAVETQVRRTLAGAAVERFSGVDRIDTAAKAALSAPAVPAGGVVVVANGWSPPDVGAAAPLAASLGGSVLFANEDSLGAPTVAALRRLAPSQVIIVGGTAALSGGIESQIAAVVPDALVTRLAGSDRADSAARGAALADVPLGAPIVIANGWSAADVGVAAPLAAAMGGRVLFSERRSLGDAASIMIEIVAPDEIVLVGGTDAIPEGVADEAAEALRGGRLVRVAGEDRVETAALAALFGRRARAEQDRYREAVESLRPGEVDCDAVPPLDVAGLRVVDAPSDIDDPQAPLTVAEVVRIAGGCVLVEFVALDGRTVAEVRALLADEPTVFAVGEPVRGLVADHERDTKHKEHDSPAAESQWQLTPEVQQLWGGWDSGVRVVVAVLDSGVDVTHPDLDASIVADSLGDCHDKDELGHGTHVAGIIAAEHNGFGVVGVAPMAQILPIRVLRRDSCRSEPEHVLSEALETAINNGADIINMSLRWTTSEEVIRAREDGRSPRGISRRIKEDTIQTMLDTARLQGIVTVASSGNCGDSEHLGKCPEHNYYQAPAHYTQTITVANTNNEHQRTASSTANHYVTVAAPGTKILSTSPITNETTETTDDGVKYASCTPLRTAWKCHYHRATGTSMSTPFVAGVIAHMLNRHSDATPQQIQDALIQTADHPNETEFSAEYGYGIVQPQGAIEKLADIIERAARGRQVSETADNVILQRYQYRIGTNDGDIDGDNGPRAVGPAATIAAGYGHTCAVRTDSTVQCWGENGDYWVQPELWQGNYTAIATGAGGAHSCGLRKDRTVHCVGSRADERNAPPAGNFIHIAAGSRHSCGIRADGEFTCWGANNWGQLDLPPGNYTIIAGSTRASCGIDDNGTVKCSERVTPPSGQFTTIDGGHQHYCGIRIDRTIQCWGHDSYNSHGQSSPPTGRFDAIAAGGYHSCGINTDHTIQCWGSNLEGQSNAPAGQFAAIAAGRTHTCAVKTDGGIVCWGENQFGQSNPPSGRFETEAPRQPQVDTPPLTNDAEAISVPARGEVADADAVVVQFEVTDPTNRTSVTTYFLTVR